MKWNSTFSTFSTKQKPPSVRKTCTLRPQSIIEQYTKSITHHIDAYGRDIGYYAFGDIGDRETGAQRNEQTRQRRSGDIEQLRFSSEKRVREACAPKRQGKTYTANALNQYTQINEGIVSPNPQPLAPNNSAENSAFVPSYDANGNQTLVQTTTGTWTVAYNGAQRNEQTRQRRSGDIEQLRFSTEKRVREACDPKRQNRPITWTQDTTTITMEYDYAGRRISYKKMQGDALVSHTKFLYKGFLCVQQLSADAPWNVLKAFIWDPTEATATRPLIFTEGEQTFFYMHDGNKNITDVISSTPASSEITHYDYAPFGAVVRAVTADISTHNSSPITHNSAQSAATPFRFSSEWHDDDLGLVYYNYRHYNPTDGRWMNRDLIEEQGGGNLYGFVGNRIICMIDVHGLFTDIEPRHLPSEYKLNCLGYALDSKHSVYPTGTSLKKLVKSYGYDDCEKTDKPCTPKDCHEVIIVYIYNYCANPNEDDPWSDNWIHTFDGRNDYHAIKGPRKGSQEWTHIIGDVLAGIKYTGEGIIQERFPKPLSPPTPENPDSHWTVTQKQKKAPKDRYCCQRLKEKSSS